MLLFVEAQPTFGSDNTHFGLLLQTKLEARPLTLEPTQPTALGLNIRLTRDDPPFHYDRRYLAGIVYVIKRIGI
jgi:hypothetical protein